MGLIICRTCKEEFDPAKKRVRFGYVNQCDDCGRSEKNEPDRFLGRRGEKGIGIELFRTNLSGIKTYLKNENRSFGPGGLNLGSQIVSPGFDKESGIEKTKEDLKREKSDRVMKELSRPNSTFKEKFQGRIKR